MGKLWKFLESVKVWVAKSHPSFLQISHISPILDKITQPFSPTAIKINLKKVISTINFGMHVVE